MKNFNHMKTSLILLTIMVSTCLPLVHAEEAGVHFIEPMDKQVVASPFKVKFGLTGKQIGPLGDMDTNKGHHHLIVDGQVVMPLDSVPFDDKHKHFGAGQTETELSLTPGMHTLTLQFGNGAHQSYGAPWSKTITINVRAKPTSAIALPPTAW